METVKLVVYGTLMSGERNHYFCRNAISIIPCTIKGLLYDTGWGYPVFQPYDNGVVKAELIEIPREDWADIDRLEGYPKLYERKLYSAKLLDGTMLEGWVYFMQNLPRAVTLIESGDWKEYRLSR